MTIKDVEGIFSSRYSEYNKPLSVVSLDDNNNVPLCDNAHLMYSYDDIVKNYNCEDVIPSSWDAISITDNYINFIEFKNTAVHQSKVKKDIRSKVAEGLHILERCILGNNFLVSNGINTRFILVYSKEKNEKYLLSKDDKERKARNDLYNSLHNRSTLRPVNNFIGNKFHDEWHYVTDSLSMDDEIFMKNIFKYIKNE